MNSRTVFGGVATAILALCVANAAEAHSRVRHHISVHAASHSYAYRPMLPIEDAAPASYHSYQAYAGYGSSYGSVPHDPLIPLRQETPPAVDPNEPASGSYGAMLEGRNPANTTP